ncbi:hypothetical protein DFJ74DRAFT_670550 [Hyaloraphidium curvatum]|nr:hypothetical protein DFJ74DRAFT_670550 [Hyaloraphidium curvatum]
MDGSQPFPSSVLPAARASAAPDLTSPPESTSLPALPGEMLLAFARLLDPRSLIALARCSKRMLIVLAGELQRLGREFEWDLRTCGWRAGLEVLPGRDGTLPALEEGEMRAREREPFALVLGDRDAPCSAVPKFVLRPKLPQCLEILDYLFSDPESGFPDACRPASAMDDHHEGLLLGTSFLGVTLPAAMLQRGGVELKVVLSMSACRDPEEAGDAAAPSSAHLEAPFELPKQLLWDNAKGTHAQQVITQLHHFTEEIRPVLVAEPNMGAHALVEVMLVRLYVSRKALWRAWLAFRSGGAAAGAGGR